jgi:hypothetical protein
VCLSAYSTCCRPLDISPSWRCCRSLGKALRPCRGSRPLSPWPPIWRTPSPRQPAPRQRPVPLVLPVEGDTEPCAAASVGLSVHCIGSRQGSRCDNSEALLEEIRHSWGLDQRFCATSCLLAGTGSTGALGMLSVEGAPSPDSGRPRASRRPRPPHGGPQRGCLLRGGASSSMLHLRRISLRPALVAGVTRRADQAAGRSIVRGNQGVGYSAGSGQLISPPDRKFFAKL